MNDPLIFLCPHCNMWVEIVEINCGIFRHGVYKQTGIQMPPHAPRAQCDDAVTGDLIWGCGRPFEIYTDGVEKKIRSCDYV